MSTLGERIKHSRESKGILQGDLAKLIGVKSAGIISNWERDLNKPDAEKIVKLCNVLGVSASFLLDYYGKTDFELFPYEINHIKQYRSLDPHGKEMVDIVLQKEWERSTLLKPAAISSVHIVDEPELNAAPERPDASVENQEADNTMMDTEKF